MTPFWSAITEAWVKQDTEWIKATMNKLKLLWLVLTILTICMLLVSSFVYKLWVGKDLLVPVSISMAMASYVIINAWNGIYSQFLNGVGKIKLQLYIAMAGTIINIPLAIYLGNNFGIYGVVLSTTIISIAAAIISPIQYNRIINNRAHGVWVQ